MKPYEQLSIEEREYILEGLRARASLREIAFELRRSPSTIAREVKRNIPGGVRRQYTPRLAHERAKKKIKERGRRSRLKNETIRNYVHEKLMIDRWSPEQIAGTLKHDYQELAISHEAIYQNIYSTVYRDGAGYPRPYSIDLRCYLKRGHKRRKRKHISYKSRVGAIANRRSIDARPEKVSLRRELGHWEGDSIVSRKSKAGLNTLVERVSGLVKISKVGNGTSAETTRVVTKWLATLPSSLRRTLTVDNGSENAGHEKIKKEVETDVYFAHPYHSWERGTNENTNGLIRYYFPKGTDFATITDDEIASVEYALNTRPRKRLNYQTPLAIFTKGVALKH